MQQLILHINKRQFKTFIKCENDIFFDDGVKFEWTSFNTQNKILVIIDIIGMKSNIDYQCLQIFKELKFSKIYRFLIYKVDGERVILDKTGAREQDWSNFIQSLPEKQPRMSVFDLEYTNNDSMNCSKLFFCYWLPDGTPLKVKLLYATFKQNFRTFLDVGGKEIILNSADDYTKEEIIKQFDK